MGNEDYGLPPIDEETAKIINYIFMRFRGAIPSLRYSADSVVSIDSIRSEYTYAFMRHEINDLDIINRAIELLVDDRQKFLPPPGEFIGYCHAAINERNRRYKLNKQRIESKKEEIEDYLEEKAVKRYKDSGKKVPQVKLRDHIMDGSIDSYRALLQPYRKEIENIKLKIAKEENIDYNPGEQT